MAEPGCRLIVPGCEQEPATTGNTIRRSHVAVTGEETITRLGETDRPRAWQGVRFAPPIQRRPASVLRQV